MIRHYHLDQIDWPGIKERIPISDSEYDKQRRDDLWEQFDPNGNNLVSLAEADLAF